MQLESVSKGYGSQTLFEDLSFKLNRGERCGLVGRNGSGKTTLLRILCGEEESDAGEVSLPKGYSLGYLSQHLKFSKDSLLEEAALGLPEDEKEALYKVKKILFGLGFKEPDMLQPPTFFSGGYQLRIHLAKVLIQNPDGLLLDEPTNYLDIVSIRWLTRFLQNWKGELLLISHDRDFMDRVTTHTVGIHRKKVFKLKGGTEKFYTYLLEQERVYEKTRLNLEKKKAHMASFVTKLGAKASKATQAQARKKALARMPVLEELAKLHHLDFAFPYAPFHAQRLLLANQVSFKYETMEEGLIDQFDLEIERGDRIALVGKNGRGKSTLLRLLAQDLKPDQGKVKLSKNIEIGFFGQTNIDRLHPQSTVEEEIAASAPHLKSGEIRKICGVMLFSGDDAKKPIHVLSGGERSRVLLGKILASPSNLLLLDEPTNHLDMESIEALVSALEMYEGAVVLVTHSEMILRALPSKFVICHQGNQHLFHGDYDLFLEKEGWEKGEALSPKKGGGSEKERRHQRAELTRQRAKALKPIQQQIDRVEVAIIRLEQECEADTRALQKASEEGDGGHVATLSKGIGEKQREIEHLFQELEALMEAFEKKKSEFA